MTRPVGAGRLVIYCLVPEAAAELALDLRSHYGDDPRVEVIVDRRIGPRRAAGADNPPAEFDRRRGSERRRKVLPRVLAPLPDGLAARAGAVTWVQRLLPVGPGMEELDTQGVVERLRAGDPEAPTELYWRYYERAHSRLCVLLVDAERADAAVVDTFGRVLDALDDPARAELSFEALLYEEIDRAAPPADATAADDDAKPASIARVDASLLEERVAIQKSDPRWSGRARAERHRLLRALPSVEAIEHVGSTAVTGIAARPIVDLLVGVASMPPPRHLVRALERAGYDVFGDIGTPDHVYFRKRGPSRFDVHVVQHAGDLWHEAIAIREYLRRHPSEGHRWASAKYDAARSAPDSLLGYLDLRARALAELTGRATASSRR